MKKVIFIFLCALCTFSSAPAAAQQKDATGCKDHPLLTRMPGYWIRDCRDIQFDAYPFAVATGKTEPVEGHVWKLTYYPTTQLTSKPSELQILRNFEAAVTKAGGKTVFGEKSRETLRLTQDGKEIWVEVRTDFTSKYWITVLEKTGMAQDIVADAAAFSNDLKSTGHAAVYGIHFDTGKSEIKPESAQAIAEVAKLLTGDPALKVFVVGHTDNVGTLDANMRLSQDRAEAVVQALVKTHGIAAARLKSFGNGPYSPVASNDAETGRAKNRRVELVKQ